MRRQTHYLDRDGGWQQQAGGQARIRIDSSSEIVPRGRARNQIYRLGEQGWEPVADERLLSPLERGLVFWLWPERIGKRELVGFRGVRVVDEPLLAGPLAGLRVFSRSGRELADPLAAGEEFLLDAAQAKTFAARISELGGQLYKLGDRLPAMRSLLIQLREVRDQMQSLIAADLMTLKQSREEGNFAGELEFDERGVQARRLAERGHQLWDELRVQAESLERNSTELTAELLSLADEAAGAFDEIECLDAARRRSESMLARYSLELKGTQGLNSRDGRSEIDLQILFRDLADLLRRQGIEAELEPDRISFATGEGEIQITRREVTIAAGTSAPGHDASASSALWDDPDEDGWL